MTWRATSARPYTVVQEIKNIVSEGRERDGDRGYAAGPGGTAAGGGAGGSGAGDGGNGAPGVMQSR